MGAAAFVEDIRLADRQLARFRSFRRWFRFPMLHEGRTVEERDAVRRALKAMGYLAGYVTVDNYEWYLDLLARRAVKAGRKLDLSRLGKLYLPALLGPLAFYDEIARRVLKRAPAHVLLLHENDLAALFVGDLVAALRRAGWGIIHPDEAYRDPIAALEPATLFNGQGRIAALARAAGYRGVLGHASESTRYWERVFPSVVLR